MLDETYIKPTMAVILIREKINSASPYVLTPNRLITTITRRNIATKTDLLIASFQYPIVKAPAIISKGRTNSHCRQ